MEGSSVYGSAIWAWKGKKRFPARFEFARARRNLHRIAHLRCGRAQLCPSLHYVVAQPGRCALWLGFFARRAQSTAAAGAATFPYIYMPARGAPPHTYIFRIIYAAAAVCPRPAVYHFRMPYSPGGGWSMPDVCVGLGLVMIFFLGAEQFFFVAVG